MSRNPILLMGGSGVVGRWTARQLRAALPEAPLLIGGRDRARAEDAAAAIGHAEAVVLDMTADDLGLGDRAVAAVAVLFMDAHAAGLRFAQSRGVPYVSIAPLLHEIAPEVAYYAHAPGVPVVLGTEWLVGATTMPVLERAGTFGRLDTISIAAVLDDEDAGGPAQLVDLERVTKAAPPALSRRDGAFVWHSGDDTRTEIRATDGTGMPATALSPHDVVTLAAATGAPNVRFDLATGVSSSRRRGEPMSTEIVVDLAGSDRSGQPMRTRFAVVHPQGQMPLTGLGVAMVLERLAGLDGAAPPSPGLYFPSQLLDPRTYRGRLGRAGGSIEELAA